MGLLAAIVVGMAFIWILQEKMSHRRPAPVKKFKLPTFTRKMSHPIPIHIEGDDDGPGSFSE